MDKEKDIFDHIKVRKIDVPDSDYFKNLADVVIEKQRPKIIPMYKRPLTWVSAAAAVIVIAILVTNMSTTPSIVGNSEVDPLLALNDFSSEELMSYINEHIDDFDTDLIAEMIPDEVLDGIELFEQLEDPINDVAVVQTSNQNDNPIKLDGIDDQDILDYFNDEGLDLEDLEDDESFI